MLLTAMHDNPNQGFWQANAKNNPPAIIKESTVSPDKRMILFCMCFENQSAKPCSSFVPCGTNGTACRALHNFTEELSNRQEVQ